MDPFSALGLAAAVVQFVQFGSKLVSESQEIYQSATGSTIEHAELERACQDLSQLSASLATSSAKSTFHSVPRSDKEEALRRIAVECQKMADDICIALRKMGMNDAQCTKLRSFRHALRSAWGRRKVESLEKRLDKHKLNLSVHLAAITWSAAITLLVSVDIASDRSQ
jgi:hypothetical protein